MEPTVAWMLLLRTKIQAMTLKCAYMVRHCSIQLHVFNFVLIVPIGKKVCLKGDNIPFGVCENGQLLFYVLVRIP